MPIYEYKCSDCESEFEILVRGEDGKKLNCPQCGSENIDRLFSSFGFSMGSSSQTSVSSSSSSVCSACTSRRCSTCK